MGSYRIGIDTGGTFTDLVLYEEATGRLLFHKTSSTPDDPARAVVAGVEQIIDAAGASADDLHILVHGTTVATNAVLERRGATVAMITTAGFRDVLEIQRQDRPKMYDLRSRRAEPLVPRRRRFEVRERLRHDGSVETPLDEEQLRSVVERAKAEGADAVAVGLLYSHVNPQHERQVGLALREQFPEAAVCLSHELVEEEGEYERFSTCAMNAFVQPVIESYLGRIDGALRQAHLAAPLFVMKSNGGVMSAAAAGRHCVHTILSGPAGGVVAGAAIAAAHARNNVITADMGGTSFDVAVVHQGNIALARKAEMAGLAIKVPMLDINTVGAGGGSVGWIDAGGSLRVGPQSAGAVPGPACYGHGGQEPTVTDANLVLGRLAPTSLLDGDMQLDLEAARRTIHDRLAKPLQLELHAAAEGIIRVVNATMTAAIRKLTVERGYDPRTFTLCPFGGAGPLHGAELAHEMGVDEVLVPLAPGVTSAVGLLMSKLREDRVRTVVGLLAEIDPGPLAQTLDQLEAEARAELATVAVGKPLRTTRTLGLRYLGQGYDLPVGLAEGPLCLEEIGQAFHDQHRRSYGFDRRDQPIELVNVWVGVEVELGAIELPRRDRSETTPSAVATRQVYFRGQPHETPVFRRDQFAAEAALEGPAVIEQLDSTTVVWPGQRLQVDPYGQLVMGRIP